MEQRLIGREAELKLLNEYINSDRSEFIAVYGRRRVGKTFLIRKAVEDHFAFFMTGMNEIDLSALNDIYKTALVAEVKRNAARYNPKLLQEKFESIRSNFGKYKEVQLIGLSMQDM